MNNTGMSIAEMEGLLVEEPTIVREDEFFNDRVFHYSIEQNTEAWYRERMGRFTASPAKTFIAPFLNKDGSLKAGAWGLDEFELEIDMKTKTKKITSYKRRLGPGAVTYCKQIGDEHFNPNPEMNGFYGHNMERGHMEEILAANAFERNTGLKLEDVGFISWGPWLGASPDKISINKDFGWETKSANRSIHRDRLLDPDSFLKEHEIQCQFSMFISGFDHWYLNSFNKTYSIGADLLTLEIGRDEELMEVFEEKIKLMRLKSDEYSRILSMKYPN